MAADANHGATVNHLMSGYSGGALSGALNGNNNFLNGQPITELVKAYCEARDARLKKRAQDEQQANLHAHNKKMLETTTALYTSLNHLNVGINGAKADKKVKGSKDIPGIKDYMQAMHADTKGLKEGVMTNLEAIHGRMEAMNGNLNAMKVENSQSTARWEKTINGLVDAIRASNRKPGGPTSGASPT